MINCISTFLKVSNKICLHHFYLNKIDKQDRWSKNLKKLHNFIFLSSFLVLYCTDNNLIRLFYDENLTSCRIVDIILTGCPSLGICTTACFDWVTRMGLDQTFTLSKWAIAEKKKNTYKSSYLSLVYICIWCKLW